VYAWRRRGIASYLQEESVKHPARQRADSTTHSAAHPSPLGPIDGGRRLSRRPVDVRAAAAAAVATSITALITAPPVTARVNLAVGMPIQIGQHRCSLGFFGHNGRADALAVTAGHCSDTVDQHVQTESGVTIGAVVSRQDDAEDARGGLSGSRGYTLVAINPRLSVEPFFAATSSSVAPGTPVTKYGERTGKTSGHITDIVDSAENRPDLTLLESDMVQIAGDSGCPWYTSGSSGPVLIGLASSGNQARLGGSAGSQAQPITAVIDMIRTDPSVWRDNFTVWLAAPAPAPLTHRSR
jgi:hypothetical protein